MPIIEMHLNPEISSFTLFWGKAWGDFYDRADSITLRDYAYDPNGNTTMDFNASINSPGDIRYNYLNLPEEIRFNDNARRMKNIYDAAGNKLAKILEADDNGKAPLVKETLHYVGNFVYRTDTAGNMSLQYILNEEGKITFDSLENPIYEYFIKDHLGNTRAVVAIGEDGMDTLQTVDYYPNGMIMGGRVKQPKKEDNKYLFGCKEMVNDFGSYAMYDFGKRFYDKKSCRWRTVDALAEDYPNISSYAYVANNPLIFIDPDGRKIRLANNYAGAMTNIAQIAATSMGSQVMNKLLSNSQTYTMRSTFFSSSSSFNPDNRKVSYVGNPWYGEVPGDGGALTSMIAMGHESMHAFDHTRLGFTSDDFKEFDLKSGLDPRAVSFANYLRDAYSLEPSREKYGSIDGNFNQFSANGNEKISNFTTLGSNENETSMGFSFTKTTKTVLSYKKFGVFKVPDETKTETATYYMTVSMDANNNASYQIYDNLDDYNNATSSW